MDEGQEKKRNEGIVTELRQGCGDTRDGKRQGKGRGRLSGNASTGGIEERRDT